MSLSWRCKKEGKTQWNGYLYSFYGENLGKYNVYTICLQYKIFPKKNKLESTPILLPLATDTRSEVMSDSLGNNFSPQFYFSLWQYHLGYEGNHFSFGFLNTWKEWQEVLPKLN